MVFVMLTIHGFHFLLFASICNLAITTFTSINTAKENHLLKDISVMEQQIEFA